MYKPSAKLLNPRTSTVLTSLTRDPVAREEMLQHSRLTNGDGIERCVSRKLLRNTEFPSDILILRGTFVLEPEIHSLSLSLSQ